MLPVLQVYKSNSLQELQKEVLTWRTLGILSTAGYHHWALTDNIALQGWVTSVKPFYMCNGSEQVIK